MDNFYSTQWNITTHYHSIGSSKEGFITNVYGPQLPQKKDAFLSNLSVLGAIMDHKRWILGGDLNIILYLEVKRWRIGKKERDSEGLQKLIDDLHPIDVETRNGTFTWLNRHFGSHHVVCRLDRFLVSESLMMEGLLMESNVLPHSGLDHWLVHLWVYLASSPHRKSFKFENFWLSNPNFQENSPTWWENVAISHGTLMYQFQQNLKNFKQHL